MKSTVLRQYPNTPKTIFLHMSAAVINLLENKLFVLFTDFVMDYISPHAA